MTDELAQLTEQYHAVLDRVHSNPQDEEAQAEKDDLAEKIVEVRQAERRQRDSRAVSDEGVATPEPVDATTGVN